MQAGIGLALWRFSLSSKPEFKSTTRLLDKKRLFEGNWRNYSHEGMQILASFLLTTEWLGGNMHINVFLFLLALLIWKCKDTFSNHVTFVNTCQFL